MIILVSILEQVHQKPVTQKIDQVKVTIDFMKSQLEFQRKRKMI